jgi:hypothetical protein
MAKSRLVKSLSLRGTHGLQKTLPRALMMASTTGLLM